MRALGKTGSIVVDTAKHHPEPGRGAMSTMQRVREALDRQRITRARSGAHGYRVDQGSGTSAIVHWGHNEPFRAVRGTRNSGGLVSCGGALNREGFHTVLDTISHPGDVSLVVTERP